MMKLKYFFPAMAVILAGCLFFPACDDNGDKKIEDTTDYTEGRIFETFVPYNYTDSKEWPLIIMLHGYGATGKANDLIFKLKEQVDDSGYFLIIPEGTVDSSGKQFWNASDACCMFDSETEVNDVEFIRQLIRDTGKEYNIDSGMVYILGHSNGGFMAYSLACGSSDLVTGIVSLAGVMSSDLEQCSPEKPVSIMHIHGLSDETVLYEGGVLSIAGVDPQPYPSAEDSAARWSQINECSPSASEKVNELDISTKDFEGKIKESDVVEYSGCKAPVRLIRIKGEGGTHIPSFKADVFPDFALEFLLAFDRDK